MIRSTRHLWIGGLLIALSFWASYWQWGRHKQKEQATFHILSILEQPEVDLNSYPIQEFQKLEFHRVRASGKYDFAHEVVLRNRRLDGQPGVYVVTPLILDGSGEAILVNRGFVPIAQSTKEKRVAFEGPPNVALQGIVRAPMYGRTFGPQDATLSPGDPWRDAWLRIDPALMQPQLPYTLLPIFLEVTASTEPRLIFEAMLEKKSGRDELLNMSGRADMLTPKAFLGTTPQPAHVLLPPDIHRGYVVEWIFIGCFIAAATFVVHLRKTWKQPTQA